MTLTQIVKTVDRFLIYGTGTYARYLMSFLQYRGELNKIIGVTKSSCLNDEEFFGFKVTPIEEYRREKSSLVIIAISAKYSLGISDILYEKGFNNSVSMTKQDYEYIVDFFSKLPLIKNKIFIDCYDGMGYRCNCKYISEYILQNNLPVEIVWKTRAKYMPNLPVKVRGVDADSIDYLWELYTSRIIISNVSAGKVRPDQYVILTWHGTGPFKKAGAAAYERTEERIKEFRDFSKKADLYISNSADNTRMYREDFYFEGEIEEWGYPRNDILLSNIHKTSTIKKKIGIPPGKKILLYVPTFRENKGGSFEHYKMNFPRILTALGRRFGGEFIIVYRFHHLLYSEEMPKWFYKKGIDASFYEDTQELLLIADVLITDYSSVMWDFSLMRKPVFLYHDDEMEYSCERGFYWPPSEWPYPKAHSSDEMCRVIEEFDVSAYRRSLDDFFRKDPSFDDGHASEKVVKRIMDVIEHPEKYI